MYMYYDWVPLAFPPLPPSLPPSPRTITGGGGLSSSLALLVTM